MKFVISDSSGIGLRISFDFLLRRILNFDFLFSASFLGALSLHFRFSLSCAVAFFVAQTDFYSFLKRQFSSF